MEINEFKNKLEIVLNILFEKDIFLIENNTHEQSISWKIACYLENEFKDFLEQKGYSVDTEYNRYWEEPKRSKELGSLIKPDIIIHKRGENNEESNFAIFEIKKWNLDNGDIKKLKEMTKQEGGFKYKYWIGLYNFNSDNNKVNIDIYIDGNIKKRIVI